jgi:signal transduction histidine kinase
MARPRWPLYAALCGGAAYIVAVQTGAYNPAGNRVIDDVIFVVTAPAVAAISVALGLLPRRIESVVGILVLAGALQWGDPGPFSAIIAIGFWLVGVSLGSHRRLADALRVRADELESSRAAYTEEAVRYEHIRIARELHDIVAHSLSVIVIQASVGRRLTPDDPAASELFRTITQLINEVRGDLDGLTRLLDEPGDFTTSLSARSFDELLSRAEATGSPVTRHLSDDLDDLPGRLRAVVYRVLQEGLTNAIKHAPGAAIDVTIATGVSVYIAVTNSPAPRSAAALAVPGSGRGIAGLTERVHAVNGTFTSGATPQAGWQLCAELPR